MTDETVTYLVKDYKNGGKYIEQTIKGTEFLRMFLMHVLPKGFVRIRHYGLLSCRNKKEKMNHCRKLLNWSEMIIPFKNLINDAYCRDISVKIRSHMDIKRRNGEYIGAFAAYGYLKDEENKNHLVIDDYAADVVRDIFTMKLCGMSQQSIADKLNADGILSPIQYKKSIGIELESSFQKSIKPKWSYNAVLRILKNEVYTGTVVQGKCTTPNYKIKKRIHKDEAEWIRVENMHEAIVSRSEFDLVQALLLRDTRVSPDRAEVFPLAGMVYCADCGEPMVRKTIPSNGKKYIYYVCAGNKRDKQRNFMIS